MKNNNSPRFNGGFFSWKFYLKSLIFFISLSFFILSCEEDGLIGLDMVDNKGGVLLTDTITVIAYSEVEDSVPTNGIGHGVLGLINDPVFGKYRSSFYTEFRLPKNNLSLGDNPSLDSVVLTLVYSGFYGDTLTRQTLSLYELSEIIPEDSVIYSNSTLDVKPNLLARKKFMPRPKDSVWVDNILTPPHLSIRLSNQFGNRLMAQNGKESFQNNINFLEFLKGIFITVDNHEQLGVMSLFNLFHSASALSLYYTDVDNDFGHHEVFPINQFCKRYNFFESFEHSSAIPYLQQQIYSEETQLGDSLLFLQGHNGVRIRLDMPYLKDLQGSEQNQFITINKASLIIPVDEEFGDTFYPSPTRLLLLSVDEEGEFDVVIDSQIGESVYSGVYNPNKKGYEFNITRHIQRVISGNFPTGQFVIRTSNSPENPHRVVVKGPGRTDNMRLEIIYSVFN